MQKKHIIPLVIFLILASIIYFTRTFPPINFVAGIVQSIFVVPKAAIYSLKTGSSDSRELNLLKNENAALVKKMVEFDRIKNDNVALRSQFETTQTQNYKLLPANVIGFSGPLFSPIALIIDKGENQGVKKDAGVVLQNNLIGKIGNVSPFYSEVILTVDPAFTTLARTSDTNSPGIARGNSDFILLDRVSVNDTIPNNGILLTAGDIGEGGVGLPPDFVIGKIISINRSPSLPFQTAKVESSVDFNRLEEVFVVLGF